MPRAKYKVIQGIYRIYNSLDGYEYVGSSKHILKRIHHHFWQLESNRHTNLYLQRAYNKYKEFFHFDVLELVIDNNKLIEREQWWIDTLHPEYNLVLIAGNSFNSGRKFSDETKQKMREKTKERMTPEFRAWLVEINRGNTYNLGKRLSEETKRKIGDVNRIRSTGKKQSPEQIAKRVQSIKLNRQDWSLTDETKENIAKSQRKNPVRLRNLDGNNVEFYNLTSFCKVHDLSYEKMRKLLKGKISSYEGWRLIENYAQS